MNSVIINDLAQALTEALEIKRCSICLEEVVDAVLIWPCAHCFCKSCTSSHHRGSQATKPRCPLCNAITNRRSIVQFEEIHTQYKECLDQLIAGLSLDVGFDITSYKPHSKYGLHIKEKPTDDNKADQHRSRQKKSKSAFRGIPTNTTNRNMRSNKIRSVSDRILNAKKHQCSQITRNDSNFHKELTKGNNEIYVLPNAKKEKVHNWIESCKFSQAEPEDMAETVVAQIHQSSSQFEQAGRSEGTQVQSITQSDPKYGQGPVKRKTTTEVLNTESDIEAIKLFDEFISENIRDNSNKNILSSQDEKFDNLLDTRGRRHRIITTYESKNYYKGTRCRSISRPRSFLFDDGLFQSIQEISDEKPMPSSDKPIDSISQETLEDFSSGSGEEWTLKNEKKGRLLKMERNILNNEQNRRSDICDDADETSLDNYNLDKTPANFKSKTNMKKDKNDSVKVLMEDEHVINDSALGVQQVSQIDVDLLSKKQNLQRHEVLKEITHDLNHSLNKDCSHDCNVLNINEPANIEKNELTSSKNAPVCKKALLKTSTFSNPSKSILVDEDCNKHTIKRSPGWSKLTTTKKEFHMSEKKKLNLKTISKAKTHPILPKPKMSLLQGSNTISNERSKYSSKIPNNLYVIKDNFDIDNNKIGFAEHLNDHKEVTLQQEHRQLNTSSTSLNCSPFKGFISQNECSKNSKIEPDQLICNIYDSSCTSNEITTKVYLTNNEMKPIDNKMEKEQRMTSTPIKSNADMTDSKGLAVHINHRSDISEDDQCSTKSNSVCKRGRDKDSDTYNDSAFFSPIKKKRCVDAQIQTSPGRVESLVKDIIREMYGRKVEMILEKAIVEHDLSQSSPDVMSAESLLVAAEHNSLKESQLCSKPSLPSYAKENNGLSPGNFLNDSDIVLGTEQSATGYRSTWIASELKRNIPDLSAIPKCSNGDAAFQLDEVDCDAVTQPYKTPVAPNRPNMTLTDPKSTAVSSPTQSELKIAANEFDQTHCLQFPDSTPEATPWNESGIDRLQGLTVNVNMNENLFKPSPALKDKSNKSRRQLEFDEHSKLRDYSNSRVSPVSKNVLTPVQNKSNNLSVIDNCDKIIPWQSPVPTLSCTKEIQHVNASNKHTLTQRFNVEAPTSFRVPKGVNVNAVFNNGASQRNICCTSDCHSEKLKECDKFQPNKSTAKWNKENNNKSITEIDTVHVASDDEEMLHSTNEDLFIQATPEDTRADMIHNPAIGDKHSILIENEDEYNIADKEMIKEQEEPKVEMMQVEEGDIEENTESEKQPENLCFASSLLNSEQNKILFHVLNGLGIPFSSTIGNHMSHLVVGTNDGCFKNTYKVLYAMAMHKPIISYDWVVQVVKTGGTVPLDPYIALDPKGECSVVRARKDVTRVLLKGFAIHVYNVIDNLIKKDQAEEMIQLCGGTVVPQLHNFISLPRSMFRIIILSKPPDSFTQGDWRSKYSAAAVTMDWLYSTIGHYKVSPLLPFMLDQDGAVEFLEQEGYAESLIFV